MRKVQIDFQAFRQANQALWKECFFVAVLRDFAHIVYARATSLPNPVTAKLTANEKSRKRKAFAEIECNGHSKQITRQCKCAALVRMHNLFCVDASYFEHPPKCHLKFFPMYDRIVLLKNRRIVYANNNNDFVHFND